MLNLLFILREKFWVLDVQKPEGTYDSGINA